MALHASATNVLRRLRPLSQAPRAALSTSPTADDLLSSPTLGALLSEYDMTATTSQPASSAARLKLLTHFATATGRPIASNALPKLHSAAEMAEWYARECRPSAVRPHARGLISNVLGGNDIDERIDRQRSEVQGELLETLPKNLSLDPKTFRAPRKKGLVKKGLMSQTQRRVRSAASR